MTALAADRNTPRRDGVQFELPVLAAVKIYPGAIVAVRTDTPYARNGITATTLRGAGVAEALADNSAGANGAINVKVRRGVFRFANSASGDLITVGEIGADCYIVDDQTVAKTNGTSTRSVAGKVRDVDADGVWVEF